MAGENQSILLDVQGEFPTHPEVRVQPTAQRAAPTAAVGWRYRRRYTLRNTGDAALFNHAFPINFGATNALVAGSKLQADGDDLRVWINGLEVARTLNTINSATDCYVWIRIPFLAVGGSMLVEVVYGNASAVTPPTLTGGDDLPAHDIAVTGGTRSTKTFRRYLTERIAANAGLGGWYLSSGVSVPDARFGVPHAWQPVSTLPSDDDSRQTSSFAYVDSGTKYVAIFDAERARSGSLTIDADNGADGVMIRVPTGIVSVRADIRWVNQQMGDTDVTPVGKVVILTRNGEGETWKVLYENAALQATAATIATATYTPAAPVKEIAFAVWPQEGNVVDQAARADRSITANWYTTLELVLSDVVTQTTTEAEVEIYELATELRYGGGGDAVGIPPYKSIFLGNAKSASGVGTPRLACKLNEQINVFTETRKVEVWNSGLTAKVEDVPIGAVRAIDGVLLDDGTTEDRVSEDWMPLLPVVNPLTNPSADTNATGWTRAAVTPGVTVGAITRTAAQFDSTPASFTANISANSAGANAIIQDFADEFLLVGNRQNVQVGMAIRTSDVDIQPTLAVIFYDSALAFVGGEHPQADFTIAAINTWYRRCFSFAVPEGAVYWRLYVRTKIKSAGDTGNYWWDTVAVNDTEIALIDVAIGAITLSARWIDRFSYV